MSSNRDNFTSDTKELLAKRVGYCCSNPSCRKLTIGASSDNHKTVNIGVAAHICAAAPGGKRYAPSMTPEQRKSPDNGIWLCQSCSKLIDSDSKFFTIALLKKWKTDAENATKTALRTIITLPHSPSVVPSPFKKSSLCLRDIFDIFVAQYVTDLSLEEFVKCLIPQDTLNFLLSPDRSLADIAEGQIPPMHQMELKRKYETALDGYELRCFIGNARSFLDNHPLTAEKLFQIGRSFLDGDAEMFFIHQSETRNPQKILATLVLYALFPPDIFLALRKPIETAWKKFK